MKNSKIKNLTRTALLCAVLLIMSFTPLGYLTIGPIAITFLTIPVIVGAVTSGPGVGAFLGLIFGLTSFVRSMSGIFFQINPIYAFIMAVIPRVLEGLLCGLFYKLLNRSKKDSAFSVIAGSLSCPFLNTILYMSALILLYGNSDYILGLSGGQNLFIFYAGVVGVQAIVEAVICTIAGSLVCLAILKALKRGN